jgi:hypothetical protein
MACLLWVALGSSAAAAETGSKTSGARKASAPPPKPGTAISAKARAKPSEPLNLDELLMARLPTAGPEQLLAASQVFYGDYGCDGGRSLQVAESAQHPGYVEVTSSQGRWTMKPLQGSSGALRLEDVRQVTLLVQISTKSMLLDTESGRRLLDNCVSAPQRLSRQDDGPTLGLAR